MSALAILSRVLDAFVEGIEPLFARLRPASRLVAVEDGDDIRFFAVERGRASALEGDPADERHLRQLRRAAAGAMELRLDPGRLIARTLQLPAAGREYLDSIVEHRLERLTPWRPERVVYGYTVSDEPAPEGAMSVEFLATSVDIARERAERLAALQLAPTALGSAAEPLERPLRIDLYRGARDTGRIRLRRRAAVALAVVAAVLLPAFAGSAWLAFDAEARLAAAEQRLAMKRQVLAAASGTGEAGARDVRLISAKTPETAAVRLVDRIATLLPDDTWLRELEIDGARVRLAGFSADAPALIPVLEGDEALSDVRFSAPVTRDDQGRDGFDIVAQWDQRVPPAAEETSPGGAEPVSTGALP